MAKKISAKDIFQSEDIFIGIRDSAKETIKMMQELKSEVEKTASSLSQGLSKKSSLNSTKEIEKVVKVTKQANTLKKEAIQIDKLHSQAIQQEAKANQELEKIEQQKIKTAQQQQKLDSQSRKEKERLQKIQDKQKKSIIDESDAYKVLVKQTREAKNESKRLGAELLLLDKAGKKNTKQYRELSQAYNKMTTEAKKGDKALKQLDKSVGDNFRNVGNYKQAISGLVSTLGTLGAGVGIGQIFRNVTGIMIDFDQAQADLSAISGKTTQELSGLTQQAKDLGATTQFSATQITEMQIELAKLGFTTEQITQSTEAVSNFASATGADLASASKVAGASLRMFNLDASEMDRVVSTLGVATTKSALSFGDFESAMANVGPVANAFGFSIEDSVTLMAKLKDAGFEASKGSVAVRNIFLKLADASSPLAKQIGGPVKSMEDLVGAFKKLKAEGTDLGKALELTDARSVSAFNVFLNQADTLLDFKDSITDVNSELEAMAEKRLDSVQGKVTLLSSAWEGFILGMDDSSGASEKLKNAIGFLAENLAEIMDTILKVTRVWVIFQAVTKGQILINKLLASSFMQSAKGLTGMTGIITRTKGAFKSLGTAIKNNMGGIALVLIADLVVKMKSLNDVANTTANNMEELAEAQAEVNLKTEEEIVEVEALFSALKDTNFESSARKTIMDEINSKYGTTLKNMENEVDFNKQNALALQDVNDKLRERAELESARIGFQITQKQQVEMATELEKMQQILEDKYFIGGSASTGFFKARAKVVGGTGVSNFFGSAMASIFGGTDYQSIAREYNVLVGQYDKTLERAEKYKQDYIKKMASLGGTKSGPIVPIVPVAPIGGGPAGIKKSYEANLKEYKLGGDKLIELVKSLRKQEEEIRKKGVQTDIDGEIMNAIKTARETGEARVEIVEEMFNQEAQKRIEFLNNERQTEIVMNQIAMTEAQRIRGEELDKQYTSELKKINESKSKNKKAERQILLDQYNDRKKDIVILNGVEEMELKASEDVKNGILEASTEKVLEETTGKITEYNNKINDALDDYAGEQNKTNQEIAQEQIDNAKKTAKSVNEIVKASADYFVLQSQRKVEQINKEISEAEKQADTFRQLAINGNIDAEESLAEQQRIINEKNKERLKQEKIQQRLRLTESVLNTYSSKVQANPETALAETIKDTTLLMTFINSIPAFFDGTEDTGDNGQGVDGKGGFHAVLHPNERVVPKALNDKIGDLTNEDLTKIAVDYKNGRVIERASQTSSSLDLSVLVNELSEIKQTIRNKPETNIELGEITSSMIEMVKSTRQGNSVSYNRYKIRK